METARGRMLPLDAFAHVFEPLKGKRIGSLACHFARSAWAALGWRRAPAT